MGQVSSTVTLAADVADDATFEVPYPTGYMQASFTGSNASATAVMHVGNNDRYTEAADHFDISYGASVATVTQKTGLTLEAGSEVIVGLAFVSTEASITPLTDSSTGTASNTLAAKTTVAAFTGTAAMTGTVDGTIEDVTAISTAGGNTYADSAINAKITLINEKIKELATKIDALAAITLAAKNADSSLAAKINALIAVA